LPSDRIGILVVLVVDVLQLIKVRVLIMVRVLAQAVRAMEHLARAIHAAVLIAVLIAG
jgi:hypothetical protein